MKKNANIAVILCTVLQCIIATAALLSICLCTSTMTVFVIIGSAFFFCEVLSNAKKYYNEPS